MQNISLQQKLENFSNLPDRECALFLQSHLLEALEIEDPTYLERQVLAKFIDIEYSLRDDLRGLFNYYIERNIQNIGGVPVNTWLKEYLVKYAGTPRDFDTFLQYSLNNPEIRKLNEKDQIRLMRIFRLYDYFLIEPIASMDDKAAEYIMHFPMYLSESLAEIKTQISSISTLPQASPGKISETLSIKQAVQEYPKIGEQMVTNSPIKLKNFAQPVRPSVRNWVYDYTSHLGQTGHNSMDRTNYVFRSENALKLSSQEREKLGIILKSFDENTALPVDGERQEIVFESHGTHNMERTAPVNKIPKSEFLISKQIPNPNIQIPKPTTTANQQISRLQQQTFTKPYLKTEIETTVQTQPLQGKIGVPSSKFQVPRDNMQFVNPYPRPETHEPQAAKPDADIANVRFSEGLPQKNLPTPGSPANELRRANLPGTQQPKTKTLPAPKPAPAKPLQTQQRPPQFLHPHYGFQPEKKPEPRIEGNTIDLSGQ